MPPDFASARCQPHLEALVVEVDELLQVPGGFVVEVRSARREAPQDDDAERSFIDLVAAYNATDALTFVLNYDWGKRSSRRTALRTLTGTAWQATSTTLSATGSARRYEVNT
jgi:hypothetical protein